MKAGQLAKHHSKIRSVAVGFLLLVVVIAAYLPALSAGYIWDDDDYVTANLTLRSRDGLRRIWFEPTSIPQYYPVVHTSFWVEYQLWKLKPFGYHLVNIFLHAANALLLWRVLLRLKVPGALVAALIFALHPVHVESVAWITERKNVLSGFFFFLSLLTYFRYAPLDGTANGPQKWMRRTYVLSLVLFLAALLSKSVTVALPAVILLLIWWKRGGVTRRDIIPLVPMFVVGLVVATVTVWMERYHVGAAGIEWELTFLQRIVIAGRALWFYAGKLVWPYPLMFNYPRWDVDTTRVVSYLFPIAVLTVYAALWGIQRQIGRGPLVAVLVFSGVLLPALGFIDVYPMRYSFVADHFQYLASASLITLGVAVGGTYATRLGAGGRRIISGLGMAVCVLMGILTFRQTTVYEGPESLWLDTIEKNPGSWMADYHMGWIRAEEGRIVEAENYYRAAIEYSAPPNRHHHMAINNLAMLLAREGKKEEAEAYYRKAMAISPTYTGAMSNLGSLLRESGRCEEAVRILERALSIDSEDPGIHNNMGSALACEGRHQEAIDAFRQGIQIDPGHVEAHYNLANAYGRQGLFDMAETHFDAVAEIGLSDPARIHSLAQAYMRLGKPGKAAALYQRLIQSNPEDGVALASLAWILATSYEDKIRNGKEALKLAGRAEDHLGRTPLLLDVMAAAYAEQARFEDAVRTLDEALKLASEITEGGTDVEGMHERQTLYRNGHPYRGQSGPL